MNTRQLSSDIVQYFPLPSKNTTTRVLIHEFLQHRHQGHGMLLESVQKKLQRLFIQNRRNIFCVELLSFAIQKLELLEGRKHLLCCYEKTRFLQKESSRRHERTRSLICMRVYVAPNHPPIIFHVNYPACVLFMRIIIHHFDD